MGNELTPEQLSQFRSNLAGPTDEYVRGPNAPAAYAVPQADPNALGSRLRQFGATLGPVLGSGSTAAAGGASALGAGYAAEALRGPATRVPFVGDGSDTVSAPSATRAGPPTINLQPMPSADLTFPGVPTLAQQRAPSGPGGGSAGGGGPNPLTGLAGAYKQAQTNQFGTLDEQRDLLERKGELQGERINKTSDLEEVNAARKIRDAEVMAQHQAQVQQKHDAFLARNEELANQIGAEKIDPSRIIGDKSIGEKISLLLSGILSGAAGQGAQFMARMDGLVDQGVKAQMANVDNQKAKLSARQNLFSQMMAESGDRRVAETQTKQLIWEALKQKMGADSARLGIPEVTNNADLAMNQVVDQRINPLRVQMTGDAYKSAIQQAQAAASAQRAAEDRAFSRAMQVAELGVKKDAGDLERAKFEAENGTAETGGLGKAGRQSMALETAKAQRELDGTLSGVTSAQKDIKAITAGGTLGNAAAHALPAWVPGVTGAQKDVNAREAYNALVRPGVGAAWKLRTGGVEPKNPTILEEQSKAFMVQPSDSEEVVQDRMDRFRKHMNESAASAGAAPAALPSGLKFGK